MAEGSAGTRNITLIAAAILAIGIIVGGFLLGDGLRRARMADRAVTVRGLAERNVTADLATWTVTFSEQGSELGSVQAEIDRDARTVLNFFRTAGFTGEAITDAGGSVSQFFDSNRGENNVTITRRVQLRTTDV
ncbi:MAG TPA: SIMPL domain-containing protein, partial [Allosphingosinicella sp.]|nr:SIMPL domain-containing protein [Allosphingosinicella sp.]